MGNLTITNRVYWRDDMGRFANAVETGAARAIEEASEEGARLAREIAPKKTGRLAGGIHPISRGAGQGGWATADVPYALPQEEGAGPHVIGAPGQLLANKEDGFAARGPVWHPGNEGRHFMGRSLSFMRSRLRSILARNMP